MAPEVSGAVRALETLTLEELRSEWRRLYGPAPRPASTELVLDARRLFGQQHSELALNALRRRLQAGEEAVMETGDPGGVRIHLPVRLQFRGGRCGVIKMAVRSADPPGRADPILIKGLKTAHALLEHHRSSPLVAAALLNAAEAPDTAYERRLARLAFLAPDLQQAILDGRHPAGLTVQALVKATCAPPPLDWEDQRRWWRGLG